MHTQIQPPHSTQETRLSILPDDTCRLLNTSMLGYRSDVEFCAGNRVQFPKTTVYRRYLVQGEDKAYTYKKIKTLLNPVRGCGSIYTNGNFFKLPFCSFSSMQRKNT